MLCPSDFCPGCGQLNCSCEEDERAAIMAAAEDSLHCLTALERALPEMSATDETALAEAIEEIRSILNRYTED